LKSRSNYELEKNIMKTLSDLDHPNIVRMIESAEVWDEKDIKEYGIVMEYLENGSLYNLKKPDLY
jgi:serine/threonine protein kinase